MKYQKFYEFVLGEMGDTKLDAETLRHLYDAAEDEGIKPMPTWEQAGDLMLSDDTATESPKEDQGEPGEEPADDSEEPADDTEDDGGEDDGGEEGIELPADFSGTITVKPDDGGEKGSED